MYNQNDITIEKILIYPNLSIILKIGCIIFRPMEIETQWSKTYFVLLYFGALQKNIDLRQSKSLTNLTEINDKIFLRIFYLPAIIIIIMMIIIIIYLFNVDLNCSFFEKVLYKNK